MSAETDAATARTRSVPLAQFSGVITAGKPYRSAKLRISAESVAISTW